jgi:hypothetical protein
MLSANKTVKMAEKRAMVDAILRCAALSQWFTQDLAQFHGVNPRRHRAVLSAVISA